MNTFITFIVLMSVLSLPFILMYNHHKRKEGKLFHELKSLAGEKDVSISSYELWRGCYAIGIDNDRKKLFYVNKLKGGSAAIDLRDVEECKPVIQSRNVRNGRENVNITDRIELVLSFRMKEMKNAILEFYDNTEFMTPDGENPLAEKWARQINMSLK